jgi:hypothetical protein
MDIRKSDFLKLHSDDHPSSHPTPSVAWGAAGMAAGAGK